MDIKLLSRQGHSIRDIARRTGHARNTVRRMLRSDTPPEFSTPDRANALDPFKPYLTRRFDEHGLSAVRLHAEIVPQGYAGSVHAVRRFLATLRPMRRAAATATLRFETAPGEQAQVDWAHCGKHVDASGREIRIYAFVMVLSFSRMLFVRFTDSMGVEALIECHRLAFERFGGMTAKILYDNTKEVWLDPSTLNPAFAEFAAHHGFVPKRCRAYRPRTKGKVERSIQYVENSFLRGSVFADLDDLNSQAAAWSDSVADVRVHATTGERPIDLFAKERETLAPLSALRPYRFVARESRTVGSESTVRFRGSRYSVPPKLVGTRVDVSGEAGRVKVRCGDVIVAEHDRAERGACVMRSEDVTELWKLAKAKCATPPPAWRLTGTHEVEAPSLGVYGRIGVAEFRSLVSHGRAGGRVMSASTLYEHAATTSLEHLGLRVARDRLDQACQKAAADSWSYSHFLGWLLDGEIAERKRRGIELNLQFARFPYRKRLDDFDFAAQPSIDRRLVDELATGRFAGEGRNVILLGPPGVGKTHVAIALGVRAAELGMRVYFTSAMELARRLSKAMAENRLHREMRNLVRPSVLVIDEVGYLSLEAAQASLLFQVIAERYDKGQSIILTSNPSLGMGLRRVGRRVRQRRGDGVRCARPAAAQGDGDQRARRELPAARAEEGDRRRGDAGT